jgi:hypothetical protein
MPQRSNGDRTILVCRQPPNAISFHPPLGLDYLPLTKAKAE